jgi:hypothetical protein
MEGGRRTEGKKMEGRKTREKGGKELTMKF